MRNFLSKFKNDIFLIGFLAILGKLIIYLAELLIATKFGASRVTDAFIMARAIPLRIGSIVSWALYSAFVPFYLKTLKNNREEAKRLSSVFFNNVLLVSIIASLFLSFGANVIIKLLAPGFDQATVILSARLLRIMCWSIFLVSLSAIFQSINASKKHQLVASLSQPLNNLVIFITFLILIPYFGIYAAALGVLLGSVCKLLIQFVSLNPISNLTLKNKIREANNSLFQIWKLFFAVVCILLVNESIMVIIRLFASHYEGDISILNYGYIVAQVPILVIETLIFYFFYPIFVERSITPNSDEFKSTILKFMRAMIFLVIPISTFMIILSGLISRVLFLHGKFVWATADKTALAISLFSLGLLGLAIDSLTFRLAIIINKIRDYSILLVTRLILNIILSIVLIGRLKPIIALPLSFSLALIFNTALLMLFIGKAINYKYDLAFLEYLKKILTNTFVAGGMVFSVKQLFAALSLLNGFSSRLVALCLISIMGAGVYLYMAHIYKMKELSWLVTILTKKVIPEITEV